MLAGLALAGFGLSPAQAGFRSPESAIRNLYAYYGDGAPNLSRGMPHDPDTARQFFARGLRGDWLASRHLPYDFFVQNTAWTLSAVSLQTARKQFEKTYIVATFSNRGHPITLNFVMVSGPDGWTITDVESPYDSLRLFLAQHRQ